MLEIGFGTGLNLPHYPSSVRKLAALDPLPALQEMSRVLRPDGQLLFIEHGLSEDPGVACWQRRLSPLHRGLSCGGNLDRSIGDLLAKGGFLRPEIKRFVLAQGPRIFTATYQSLARP